MCYELDLLEEKRDLATLRTTSYKRWSERYFNSKVKERRFKESDLVLRRFCLTLKRSMLEFLGLIGKVPML